MARDLADFASADVEGAVEDHGVELDALHPVVRRLEVGAHGEGAMVLQEDGVVGLEVGGDGLGDLVGGRGSITVTGTRPRWMMASGMIRSWRGRSMHAKAVA